MNIISLYLFLIDSGGGAGLRFFSLLYVFLNVVTFVLRNGKFYSNFFILWCILIISLIPSIIISLFSGIDVSSIVPWIVSLFIIPFAYIFVVISGLKVDHLIYSGSLFACTILLIFFGRFFNISFFAALNDFFLLKSNGFFGYISIGELRVPNVYFQATLSLVSIGVISVAYKRNVATFLILAALMVAPSRTGFALVLSYYLYTITFYDFSFKKVVLFFSSFLLVMMFLDFPLFNRFYDFFSGDYQGTTVRIGHISSIIDIFENNPAFFFFGQGPGSSFYSIGTNLIENNIEISQLEYIRKFGFFSFVSFVLLYFGPFLKSNQINRPILHSLLLYFLASLSNPVMSSFFIFIILSLSYTNTLRSNYSS